MSIADLSRGSTRLGSNGTVNARRSRREGSGRSTSSCSHRAPCGQRHRPPPSALRSCAAQVSAPTARRLARAGAPMEAAPAGTAPARGGDRPRFTEHDLRRIVKAWPQHKGRLRKHLAQPKAGQIFRDEWSARFSEAHGEIPADMDILDYFDIHAPLRLEFIRLLFENDMRPLGLLPTDESTLNAHAWHMLILSTLSLTKTDLGLERLRDEPRLARSSNSSRYYTFPDLDVLFVDCSGLAPHEVRKIHEEAAKLMEPDHALVFVGQAWRSELLQEKGTMPAR